MKIKTLTWLRTNSHYITNDNIPQMLYIIREGYDSLNRIPAWTLDFYHGNIPSNRHSTETVGCYVLLEEAKAKAQEHFENYINKNFFEEVLTN